MADDKEQKNYTRPVPTPPGALCAVPYSKNTVLDFSDEEINAIKEKFRQIAQRDEPAHREMIILAWEARLFDRGKQHLLPKRNGGWTFPAPGTGYSPAEVAQRSVFTINMYNSLMQIIVAALSRDVPTSHFLSRDPDDDDGITAAEAAESLRGQIIANNEVRDKLAEIGRYLWTDSVGYMYTDYWKDGQAFGWEPMPASAVPEDEHELDAADEEQNDEGDEADKGDEKESPRIPRGRERMCTAGCLEVKISIKANALCETPFLRWQRETDLGTARAMFPDAAGTIEAGATEPGGDDIDRLARINVLLGVQDNFVTSDSQAYDVTLTTVWMRPAEMLTIPQDEIRDSLLKKCKNQKGEYVGLEVTFAGETFCQGRRESLDDHWSMANSMPGDGNHRNAMGQNFIPAQKVLNNWMELTNDYLIRGVPATHMDNEMFNVAAIGKQTNVPGAVHGFDREPGVTMDQVIWREPDLQPPEQLKAMIDLFRGELAEMLTGALPALFGGDSGSEGVGDHLSQRDQALGRIGLAWNSIKNMVARSTLQAVQSLARNHEGAIKTTGSEAVTVEMEQLKGEIIVEQETDENFPESFTQIQARVLALFEDMASNPQLAAIFQDPGNLRLIKNAIGLKKLEITELVSNDKQLGEFRLLLAGFPHPNPQLVELEQQVRIVQQRARLNDPASIQALPELVSQLSQLQQSEPPEVSSVPIDEELDNHDVEAMVCWKMLSSPRGREMKYGSEEEQEAYLNLRLHWAEHTAAAAKKKQAQLAAGAPPKPVSLSANVKDLPPKEAAQVMEKANIQSSPQDFAAETAAEAVSKHPGPAGITVQ